MNKEKVKVYQKEYRENYGDKMKKQIKEWFQEHPNYWREWRNRNLAHRRQYERGYWYKRSSNFCLTKKTAS